jgi:protein-L-isoaspartate(D-aspartate) O-methyltransferase
MKPASWPSLLTVHFCLASCQDATIAATEPYANERQAMVELQLRGRDITDRRVLEAMGRVPRHEFVPQALRDEAYRDHPLPIGHDQTISQPYIVAFMTQALKPRPEDRVLEVGTGSGYQAAVLAGLVREVYTIEIVAPLGERARDDLARLGYRNVQVRIGDGYEGWPEHAPFDAIIVTCSPEHVPPPLVEQLRDGGRMIIPVGDPRRGQELVLLEKRGGKVVRRGVMPVRFVPMTGRAQGDPQAPPR